MNRPEPPGPGYVATPDPAWRVPSRFRRCRMRISRGETCTNTPVADLARSRHDYTNDVTVRQWWAYCPDHMYGGWVEDGQVMQWVRPAEDES